jgi:hypothetical protein
MSAEELLRMTEKDSSAVTDTQAIRDKIFEEFDASTSGEQRDALLAMFAATMNLAESYLAKTSTEEQLAAFRETRADDYTRLLVKESTVDGTVSPEMLMAVTNREISAGRMTVDDPIRKYAVTTAASPHPSHAELLERAEVKMRSDMSIESLVNDLRSAKAFDIVAARAKIQKEFDAATTSDQFAKVLAIFKAVMDEGERQLVRQGNQEEFLAKLKDARALDYKIFIVQECTVGLDSPGGGDVSVEMLVAVTNREIVDGRMTEDHSLRKIAVEGAAAPHLSHSELLAKHAKLKEEVEKSKAEPTTQTPPGNARLASAFGATLGKKLKGLFRTK